MRKGSNYKHFTPSFFFFFFFFSLHEHKLCCCSEFVYRKNLILQKYFFWGYSKWQKTSASGLNRGLSNFGGLRSANHMKFTKESVYGEVWLGKKYFFHLWAKHRFATLSLNWKDSSLIRNTPLKKNSGYSIQ